MHNGQDEWSNLGPGAGLTFADATGGGRIGMMPLATRPPTMGHGVSVFDPSGVMTLSSHGLLIGDKDGRPVLVLPQ
jgi:hypothetical protein